MAYSFVAKGWSTGLKPGPSEHVDVPGRRTLTDSMPPAGSAVQRKEAPTSGERTLPTGPPPTVHDLFGPAHLKHDDTARAAAAVQEGINSSTSPLPHMATIQRAFGHHDVSSIQAHVGTEAAAASARAMNARAYATGNHVVFGNAPDLHTAAHEAAHVVQQRGGLRREGGVGAEGDQYEQHADAVADAVVAGRSAAALLSEMTPSSHMNGVDGKAIQRLPETYMQSASPARYVRVTENGLELRAEGVGYSHWAKLEIAIDRLTSDLVLHEIEAHPAEGSNLGALLVYHLAEKAAKRGQATIAIDAAAASARGFYKAMGFTLVVEMLQLLVEDEADLSAVQKVADIRELESLVAVGKNDATLLSHMSSTPNAPGADLTDPVLLKAFKVVCEYATRKELEDVFPAVKDLDAYSRVQYFLRLKRLEVGTPMSGKTDVVLQRAQVSMEKRWHNVSEPGTAVASPTRLTSPVKP